METLETVKRMVATVRCPKCKNDFWLLDAQMFEPGTQPPTLAMDFSERQTIRDAQHALTVLKAERTAFTGHSNSLHEKAGECQGLFFFLPVGFLPLSRAASVAILPSALFC